jgi:hypothetical protein
MLRSCTFAVYGVVINTGSQNCVQALHSFKNKSNLTYFWVMSFISAIGKRRNRIVTRTDAQLHMTI